MCWPWPPLFDSTIPWHSLTCPVPCCAPASPYSAASQERCQGRQACRRGRAVQLPQDGEALRPLRLSQRGLVQLPSHDRLTDRCLLVPPRPSPPCEQEEEILKFWGEIDAFQTSLKLSEGRPEFTFYDG